MGRRLLQEVWLTGLVLALAVVALAVLAVLLAVLLKRL